MYSLETPDGIVKVWGSTVLDGRMDKIEVGKTIKIESLGKAQGKNYYLFNVYVAD
jgi:hypothetical protein